MKRQGIFLRTVKSRNRGRASERAVCGVFSDFSLAEPASRPAYAPAAKSPARYRAGRAKQHNHARNVKPFPPSEESGENPPRAGGGRAVPAPLSGQSFCAAHSTMPRGSFPVFSSSPWPDLPAGARLLASFWQKKEDSPLLYALWLESILWIAFALALS